MFYRDIIINICRYLSINDRHKYLSCTKSLYEIKKILLFDNIIELSDNVYNMAFYNNLTTLSVSDHKYLKYFNMNKCMSYNFSWTLSDNYPRVINLPTNLKYLYICYPDIIKNIICYLSNVDANRYLSCSKMLYKFKRQVTFNKKIYLIENSYNVSPHNKMIKLLPYYDNFTNMHVKDLDDTLPKNLKTVAIENFKIKDVKYLHMYKKLTSVTIYLPSTYTHETYREIGETLPKNVTEFNIIPLYYREFIACT